MIDENNLDEQEGAPMDSGTGSPGTSFQVPDSMGGSMDNYSLLGPSKSIRNKKKKKKAHPNNRVLSFKDFIGRTPK